MTKREGGKELDAVDSLLSNRTSSKDDGLTIANLLNQGTLKVFDGMFDQAIPFFREVMTHKPANIVASNNLATCKIFMTNNQYRVGESIKLLEDLIHRDSLANINEQVVQNLVSMYDIHFCHNPNEKKIELAEFCSKNGKDSVNANLYVQHP